MRIPSFIKVKNANVKTSNTIKIALVGNCQSTALASILYRAIGIKVEIIVDINAEGTENYKHAHWAVSHEDKVDFCFSQPLSDEFGDIASSRLREKYGSRYKQYTNLYFTGFHPDLTYFGSRKVRLQSALGDYHSKIALICYLKGMSVSQTLEKFCASSYETLNYFSSFENSKAELLRRDEANDVKFAQKFLEIAHQSLPLYTVNHPTIHALAPLAEMIVESTGLPKPQINVVSAKNPLIEGSVWPVYPEISSILNLSYPGDMIFYPAFSEGKPPMTLEDFVRLSFKLYDKVGQDNILEVEGANNLKNQDL